eukprot:TRINITY_DN2873_c0_g1_i2.p1 TRINITY_DN2873_c0_g1~~TRINITY_DN2873_c0_g1_i2.p1  ORF type:complete len:188 (-),score=28.42 TRINITY_DN2873_c0_g1_i2:178-741(-)
MIPVVLRNQFFSLVVWPLMVYKLGRGYRVDLQLPAGREIGFQFLVALFMYELVFYWTHRLLHSRKWLYEFHALHHKTKGSVGVSGMYASLLDGWAMSTGAGAVGLILVDSHVVVVWLWTFLGAINSVHSHGGYEFPFMPSPSDHELHHANYISNFGVGLFDTLCNTTNEAIFGKDYARPESKKKFDS